MKRISIQQSQFYIPLQTENIKTWTKVCAFTLTPLEEGWERVNYFGESLLDEKGNIRPTEWIYILVNKSLKFRPQKTPAVRQGFRNNYYLSKDQYFLNLESLSSNP